MLPAELAAFVADAFASDALVVAVEADDDADVADDAEAVVELAAFDADVDASEALVVAVVVDEAVPLQRTQTFEADVVADPASTIKVYFAELAFEVRGCDPEDVDLCYYKNIICRCILN